MLLRVIRTPHQFSRAFSTLRIAPNSLTSASTTTTSALRTFSQTSSPLIATRHAPSTFSSFKSAFSTMCKHHNHAGATNTPSREVLPTNVKPLRYDLTLDPDFSTFKYKGDVKIDLKVQEDSDSITLNTLEIDFKSVKVATESGESVETKDISFNDEDQTATFKFPKTFTKGSGIVLWIDFTGTLNDSMAGFYKATYKDDKGETKYLATTQMEPTDCRRAFPCFDEPALKAIFDVTLISDENLTSLSNMDVKSTKILADGRKATVFNSTPLMSTYLVAFIVGDLRYVENTSYRTPVRVYTTPGLESQATYSCDLAAKTLDYLEKTFDVKYPLPKLDNVAIADFSAGAMENWGLVTYRIVDVLFDEKTSDLDTKIRVSEVVTHELAHQWFGNLVTMDFWDGLWLNEGFATYMSWKVCDNFFPEWRVWEQYIGDNLQQALALDSLRASHPIEVPVKRADEINQIFDAISYSKGSSLLKMISNWLSEDVFIKGVSNYLKKHSYGNTQTSDLWEALSEASGKDVVEVMDIWTKKVGFPVITVEEDSKSNSIKVKQNRFLTTADVKPEEDETLYPVFLGLKTAKGTDESIVLTQREQTLKLDTLDFYKLNADQVGIYRTLYSPERWVKLGEAGKQGLLSVEDRTGLVADASALSVSGYQPTSSLLNLVNGWKTESNFFVWEEIISRVSRIRQAWIFEDKAVNESLNKFLNSLVSDKIHTLGWDFSNEKEDPLVIRLKSLLFGAASASKDPKVEKFALDAFKSYINGDKSAIHPNLRGSIFSTVARNGGEQEFDELLKIYHNTTSADEKLTALRSLGRFEDSKLNSRVLEYLFDGTVRMQDLHIGLRGLTTHKAGIEAAWKWAQENWDEVTKRIPGLSLLSAITTITTSSFTSTAKAQEVESFFATKSTKGFDQSLARSLDTIRSKAVWIERDHKDVEKWLKDNGF